MQKTLVLDTTELRRDWMFTGVTNQLLGHAVGQSLMDVQIPAPALEELIAHYGRAVEDARRAEEKLKGDWRRLGIRNAEVVTTDFDYREYLLARFDEILGFYILPWPSVSHEDLVGRAVTRTAPFDDKGGGYRDSLVWESVLELMRLGRDVVLVSADGGFCDKDGILAASLAKEVEGFPGTVQLVRDLGPWLVANLPWDPHESTGTAAVARRSALSKAQDEDFMNYFLKSDMQNDLQPGAADIGFDRAPFVFEVTSTEWTGRMGRIGDRDPDGGFHLAEYDIGELVSFEAELPENARLEDGWTVLWTLGGRQRVGGEVELVARLAVLFDEDLGMDVEEMSWRRSDGSAGGPDVLGSDHGLPLF